MSDSRTKSISFGSKIRLRKDFDLDIKIGGESVNFPVNYNYYILDNSGSTYWAV